MRARWPGLGASDNGLFRAVKKKFGTTEDLLTIGWILPDGSTIDLGEEGLDGRVWEHADVSMALTEEENNRLDRKYHSRCGAHWEMIARGAIRVQWHGPPGEFYAEAHKKPTQAQKRALRKMLAASDEAMVDVSNPEKGISEVWMRWGQPGQPRYHPDAVLRFLDERGYKGLGAKAQANWVIVATDPTTGEQVTWNTSSHSEAQRRLASIRNLQWYADTEYGREAVRYQNARIVSQHSSEGRGLGGYGDTIDDVFRRVRSSCRVKPSQFVKDGYILPDGSVVELEHHMIAAYFPKDWPRIAGRRAIEEAITNGAIRIGATGEGTYGEFILEAHKKPTDQQRRTLSMLLKRYNAIYVDVIDRRGDAVRVPGEEHIYGMRPHEAITYLDKVGYKGLRGLGKVRAPERTDEVFFKACRDAGSKMDYFEPGDNAFILPDGCFVQLDDHANIASYYPDDIMDTFKRAYNAVWDIVERGAVRVAWDHDDNLMAFQLHKKPTPRQASMIRSLSSWAAQVYVDVQDDKQGIVDARGWHIFSKREPGQVVKYMNEKGYGRGYGGLSYEGLGKACLKRSRSKEIFSAACAAAKVKPSSLQQRGWLLPDGCVIETEGHSDVSLFYPDDLYDELARRDINLVDDFMGRGAIRVSWFGDEMAFEFHKRPTSSQKSALRRLASYPKSVVMDLTGEDGSHVRHERVDIFRKGDASKVVKYMSERGFGQRVARPAGSPRGRLKFHWNAGAFYHAIELARECSGPVRQTCKTERVDGSEVTTCTWRDSKGRIVAGAAAIGGEMKELEREGIVGRRTSLWSDRDLLEGRCPA